MSGEREEGRRPNARRRRSRFELEAGVHAPRSMPQIARPLVDGDQPAFQAWRWGYRSHRAAPVALAPPLPGTEGSNPLWTSS